MKNILGYVLVVWGLLFSQAASAEYAQIMQKVIERGDKLTMAYDPSQSIQFGNSYSDLYFGGFEGQGLEFAVGQADAGKMVEIELAFSHLINAAVSGKPVADVEEHWQILRGQLVNAPLIAGSSYWELVVQSLLILLREGIEALLILAALLAYLRKAGAADRTVWVWLGAGTALVASVLTAWGLQTLMQSSGAVRESLEGATMLIAAVLLSYVSFWLFSRREIQQWQGFIQNKLGSAVDQRNLMAIVGVAFFAVYREGAETILFYQALMVNANQQWEPLLLGFGLACLLLVVAYVLIFLLSVKLPIKQFFSLTALFLYLLSIVFAGKASLELQISGWLSAHKLAGVPTISWLGIFPTWESVLLQLLFLLLPLVVYMAVGVNKQKEQLV